MALFLMGYGIALLIQAVKSEPIHGVWSNGSELYSLPNHGLNQTARAAAIQQKRATFQYGPGIGGGPSSPAGPLGEWYASRDLNITNGELQVQLPTVMSDYNEAKDDISNYDGLQTLEDYTRLYDGEWINTTAPNGVHLGLLTNYTQDLLFSMERLSINPNAVRRLFPDKDALPFQVDDATAKNITGTTLSGLLGAGRLFYADYSDQAILNRTKNYGAACDAYFYISKSSGDFLPLAIRTNVGSDLIYTPADTANDWMLAKMMYNVNDVFMGQFYHLGATHFVVEVAFQAAVRTLSDDHPVFAIFNRLMYGAFGIRQFAVENLFAPGGTVDSYFAYSGSEAAVYSATVYYSGWGGAVQSNYFPQKLSARGLVDSPVGPPLKHFPYYEDATAIQGAVRDFMGAFVDSYYPSSHAIGQDTELQAWLTEANGPAGAIDFPTPLELTEPSDLADLLAHMAYLVSTAHHAVNTNELITGLGVLPFNPCALWAEIPREKGANNLTQYLPPAEEAVGMIRNQGSFSRPHIANTNLTLIHMFDDQAMLSRMNPATQAANTDFMAAMLAQSKVVHNRSFDDYGLSQGMPFVWKTLDPAVIPWALSI